MTADTGDRVRSHPAAAAWGRRVGGVWYGVLGPLTVAADGSSVGLGGPKQRLVLALLLADVGEVVPPDRLIAGIWGDDPPPRARHTLQAYVSELRRVLDDGIDWSGHGYRLLVEAERVDAVHFERLAAAGREALPDDPARAAVMLADALRLWRGEPFADLRDAPGLEPAAQRLQGLRLGALEDRIEADLALGRHARVVDELAELTRRFPYRERLRAHQLVALYRSGRSAEALQSYERTRTLLAEEIGADPSVELQELHARILRQDPTLVATRDDAVDPDAEDAAPADGATPRNPYKGLRAFQERDADDFFGRDEAVRRTLDALGTHRLVAVVGPSGSGKSSLVRAGVVPALRGGGGFESGTRWLVTDLFPGAHPFEELAAALVRVLPEPPDDLADVLADDDHGLLRVTKRALADDDTRLLLVVDQFEELFSLVPDDAVRRRFLDALTVVATDPRGRVRVLLTLRADFFDRPLEHHGFGSLVQAGLVPLTVPSPAGLAAAIAQPADRAGLELEPGLVAAIVQDVDGQPGGLPLMQHALAELAGRRSGRRLTSASYLAAGGVAGALGNRAEALFAASTEAERRATARILLRLVTVDDVAGTLRRRVRRSELTALGLEATLVDHVLERFGDHRLLSFDRDPATGEATVEVAHEALLDGWDRLRRWVDDRRGDLLLHRRLAAAVQEWDDAGRDDGFLLGDGRLAAYDAWIAADDLPLTADEQRYLTASRDRRTTSSRRRRRRRRALVAALSTLTVAAVVLAGVALDRSRTVQVRALLASATATLDTDPELALALAVEAVDRARGRTRDDAVGVLHDTLLRTPVLRTLPGTGTIAWNRPTDLLATLADGSDDATVSVRDARDGREVATVTPGHGPVTGLAWSGDGRLLAITSAAGPTLLWAADTARTVAEVPARLAGHAFPSFGDGDQLLAVTDRAAVTTTGRSDGVVIWDVTAGAVRDRLRLDTEVYGIHLSPVSPLLLVSEPATSRASIRDVRTGERVLDLGDQGQQSDVVRFSPDGRHAAVAGRDRVKVWDADSGALVADLAAGAGVRDLAWHPHDGVLAAVGSDAVVRLLDVEAGREVRTLEGAGGTVQHVEFGPDGRELAALADHLRVWDLERPTGMELATYAPRRPGSHAARTPDGRRVVTISPAGPDAVLEVFDAASGARLATIPAPVADTRPRGPRPPPAKVLVSPDGRTIAATVNGTRTLVVDADRLEAVTVLDPGGTPAAFSPDSRRLLVGDADAARVYDTTTWRRTATLRHRDPSPLFTWYYDAAFHPSRDVVFLADSNAVDRRLTVWDLGSTPELRATLPLDAASTMVSLSADGRRVAAGDVFAGVVRVWDVAAVLSGEDPAAAVVLDLDVGGFMPGAVLSGDGRRLVTASGDGRIEVWDVDRGDRRYVFTVPDGRPHEPQLSVDGRRLLLPSGGVVHDLTLDDDELLALARRRIARPLTAQECRIHLGGACPD